MSISVISLVDRWNAENPRLHQPLEHLGQELTRQVRALHQIGQQHRLALGPRNQFRQTPDRVFGCGCEKHPTPMALDST
jgi:hypothetical protein